MQGVLEWWDQGEQSYIKIIYFCIVKKSKLYYIFIHSVPFFSNEKFKSITPSRGSAYIYTIPHTYKHRNNTFTNHHQLYVRNREYLSLLLILLIIRLTYIHIFILHWRILIRNDELYVFMMLLWMYMISVGLVLWMN